MRERRATYVQLRRGGSVRNGMPTESPTAGPELCAWASAAVAPTLTERQIDADGEMVFRLRNRALRESTFQDMHE